MTALLTTSAELDELMRSGRAPVVLDVRWRLGGPHGGDAKTGQEPSQRGPGTCTPNNSSTRATV